MRLREAAIPVHEPVRALCEFLGLDPLYVANEGKLLAIARRNCAEPRWRRCGIIRWVGRRRSSVRSWLMITASWRWKRIWRSAAGGLAERGTVAAHLLKFAL
jgi:hypothetical protein